MTKADYRARRLVMAIPLGELREYQRSERLSAGDEVRRLVERVNRGDVGMTLTRSA